MSEPTISILYYNWYGGRCVSKKAIDLYNERMVKLNPEYNIKNDCRCSENKSLWFQKRRHDPLLVEIFHELGSEFDDSDDEQSKIAIKNIPKKYENCYTISEYDGKETISINFDKYKLDKIKHLIDDIATDEYVKKDEISKILLEKQNYVLLSH